MRVHYRTELFARIESCAHYRGSTKSVYYAQYMLSSRGETKKYMSICRIGRSLTHLRVKVLRNNPHVKEVTTTS